MPYLRGSQPFRVWGLLDMVSRAACTCCPESSPRGSRGQANSPNKPSRHCTENTTGMQKQKFVTKRCVHKPFTKPVKGRKASQKGNVSETQGIQAPITQPALKELASALILLQRWGRPGAREGTHAAQPSQPPLLAFLPSHQHGFVSRLKERQCLSYFYNMNVSGYFSSVTGTWETEVLQRSQYLRLYQIYPREEMAAELNG